MPTRQTGKALYRVREVESPIHKVFRGLRIEIAIPNMAGQKPFTSIPVPSFDRPYFVCRFGDYETWEVLHKKWPSICASVFAQGFTSMEEYKPENFKGDTNLGYHATHDIAGIDTEDDV